MTTHPERSLGELSRRERWLPLDRALLLLRSIAVAVDALHARGTIHGALGPAAVRVAADGTVRLLAVHEVEARAAEAEGRAGCWSPQRLAGEAPRPADDLYALGALAYVLLVGRLPGARPAETRAGETRAGETRAARDGVRPSALSAEVERVLLAQLAPSPALRYASGTAFLAELERACGIHAGSRPARAGPGRSGPALASAPTPLASARSPLLDPLPAHAPRAGRDRPPVRQPARPADDSLAMPLTGPWVAVVVVVLCSVYLVPLYFMLFPAG